MQILHFRVILNKQWDPLLYLTLQHKIAEFKELENPFAVNVFKEMSCILKVYTGFCDKKSTGNQSKTAQY